MTTKTKQILLTTIFLIYSACYSQTVLTLEKALEIASENSPSVIQARLNLEGRQAALEAQRAALKSKFALSVTPVDYSKRREFNEFYSTWNTSESFQTFAQAAVSQPLKFSDGNIVLANRFGWLNSKSEFQQNTEIKSFTNNLYIEYTQPLFTYNRTKMNLEILELDLENAKLRYAIQKLTIENNVTQSFFNVYSNQKGLIILQEEVDNREKSYEIIKNKVDAGLSAKEELIQAELDHASSQASLYNKQVTVENAKDQLKQLIGMSLEEEIDILADISIDSVEVNLSKAVGFALDNRMELRQREIDIKSSYFNLTQQKATNEFKGNMTLSLGLTGDDENLNQIFEEQTSSPKVGVSFEIPVYDWGERKARIRQAETAIESANLTLKEERNNIMLNIRQIYRNLHNLQLQVKIQEKNIENAQLTYEINLERYKNGNLTSMDLNLFQNQLSQKKIDLTTAIIEYKLELLNLKIESLWDFENNKPVIEKNTTIK